MIFSNPDPRNYAAIPPTTRMDHTRQAFADALSSGATVRGVLHTLLSDVQRGANDLRKDIADILLDRVHHDQPVHAQYGSVQRTSRRSKSLKDDKEVLAALKDAGIDQDRVLGVDPDKVEDALDVSDLHEQDVYDIEERAYVRKADVNEEVKETRLQGLKNRLAATEGEEADVPRSEIEDLEDRIDELTCFRTGSEVQ